VGLGRAWCSEKLSASLTGLEEIDMTTALVLLASGFEEVEAMAVIDVLRRAEITVVTAALIERTVVSARQVPVIADRLLDELESQVFDALVLPGGMPGSKNLREDPRVLELVRRQVAEARVLGAICAAPSVLAVAGVLNGKVVTAYPGTDLGGARVVERNVAIDGRMVTSRGPGTALEFALALVAVLGRPEVAERLRAAMLVRGEEQPASDIKE